MASITAGNRIIPSQCEVVNVALVTRALFPADLFVDTDGDTITYTAGPPWIATGDTIYLYQLLKVAGEVRWRGDTRNVYGTPGPTLVNTPDGLGGQNYAVTIYATSADTSVAKLSFTFRLLRSTGLRPLFASPKTFSFTVSSAAIGTSVGTVSTQSPAASITTPNQYSIVWSSDNIVGDAEGVNRSPFAVNNSGLITVSGTLEIKTYYLWVRATYTPYASFDTAYVTITSTVAGSATGGYKMIDGGLTGLCK